MGIYITGGDIMRFLFFLIMTLVIPVSLIKLGKMFKTVPLHNTNMTFGYKTDMSMKNTETWTFAQKYCGNLWYFGGYILLISTVILMIIVKGESDGNAAVMAGIICLVEIAFILSSIFSTEIKLREKFDHNGKERNS